MSTTPKSAMWTMPEHLDADDYVAWRKDTDPVESAKRSLRAEALHSASMIHGELESQTIFRDDEVEQVMITAQKFFDWMWNG